MTDIVSFLKDQGFDKISANKWADLTNGNPSSLRYKQKVPSSEKWYWSSGIPKKGTSPNKGTKFTSDQIESQEFLFWEEDKRSIQDQINLPPDLGKIKPHIQVWTGNKSIHNYIRIENTKDLPKWKETQKLIILLADSDKNIHNYDRIMCHPGYINPDTKQTPLVKTFDHPIYTWDFVYDELERVLVNKTFYDNLSNFPHGSHESNTYNDQREFVWSALDWSEENNFNIDIAKKELSKLLKQNERELTSIQDWIPNKKGSSLFGKTDIKIEEPIPTFNLEEPKDPNSIDLDYDILPNSVNDILDVLLFSLSQSKLTRTLLILGTISSCMRYCEIDSQYGIEQPNSLWIGLVGESGSGKTPLLKRTFREPIEDIKQSIKNMKFPSHVKNEIKNDAGWPVFPPHPIHVISADATIEAILKYISSSQIYPKNNDRLKSSVLEGSQKQLPFVLFDDELSGVIGGQGRYSKSSEAANLASLVKLFDGNSNSIIRADNTKTVEVDNFSFNLIGGIQPDVIKNLKKTIDLNIGLWPRLLLVPCRKNKLKKSKEDKAKLYHAQHELKSICNRVFDLKESVYYLDESASDFILELVNEELDVYSSDIERQIRGKMVSHVMRLSLAIHVIDIIGNNLTFTNMVSFDTVKKAKDLYEKLYEYNVLLHQDRSLTNDVKDQLYYDFREWILCEFPNGIRIKKQDLRNRFNKSRNPREIKLKNVRDEKYYYDKLEKEGIIKQNDRSNDNIRKIMIKKQMERK